jgi:hypothetical protein
MWPVSGMHTCFCAGTMAYWSGATSRSLSVPIEKVGTVREDSFARRSVFAADLRESKVDW